MIKTLDDSQLLQLASDPRARLYPSLRGSTVFGPIVLLAGLLPCVAVVRSSEVSDSAARWGLRALDVQTANQISGWLEPGQGGLGSELLDQPPLSSWGMSIITHYLGTGTLISWLTMSIIATCCMIWAIFLLGRRLGGPAFGLVAVLAVCGHPITLRLVTGIGPAALGALWIILTVWGFLGHLEGPLQLVSTRMLAGALAWGLALLTVGPVAMVLLIPMLLQIWWLHGEYGSPPAQSSREARWQQILLGMRGLMVFAFTAISFSGWWQAMMLANYGSVFWTSWWTGLIDSNDVVHGSQAFWVTWLRENFLICGWLLVGLSHLTIELRRPSTELSRRRCQFLLLWWTTAFVSRMLFELPRLRSSVMIDAWDIQLLIPSVLVVAFGVRTMARRQTQPIVETVLVTSTAGLFVWNISNQASLGFSTFVFGLIVIALLPRIVSRIRRRSIDSWRERDWTRLLRVSMAVVIVLHLGIGLVEFAKPTTDSISLAKLRRRIASIPPAKRVTVVTLNDNVPESLLFVLRSRWPSSQFQVAGSRDSTIESATTVSPSSPIDELIIEWTEREIRITADLQSGRQIVAVGDPLRFQGSRLSIFRATPRQQ